MCIIFDFGLSYWTAIPNHTAFVQFNINLILNKDNNNLFTSSHGRSGCNCKWPTLLIQCLFLAQKPDICHCICFSRERIIIFLQKFRLFLGQCRSNNSQPLQALVGVMKKTNLTFKFPFPPCFGAQYNPSCLGPLGTVSYSWRKSI